MTNCYSRENVTTVDIKSIVNEEEQYSPIESTATNLYSFAAFVYHIPWGLNYRKQFETIEEAREHAQTQFPNAKIFSDEE